MEMSSSVSSPRNSEADKEESGWTEYFVDYEIRRLQEQEEEEEEEDSLSDSMMMSRSASMVSDAGSGPEWKLRPMVSSIPKRLNMNKPANHKDDDSLEDTASSPVNSPTMNKYLKTLDINSRRAPEETVDSTYFGKGRAKETGGDGSYNLVMKQRRNVINGLDEAGRGLADKGYCLIPNTQLLHLNYYHNNFPRKL